jgi:hypothetical protein
MIRRLVWLILGAVLGVTGYRKVAAKLNAAARVLHPPGNRGQEVAGFARDVRDGMRQYRAGGAIHDPGRPRLEYSDPVE